MSITLATLRQSLFDKARLSNPNGQPGAVVNGAFNKDVANRLLLEAMETVTDATNMPRIWGSVKGGWPITTPSTQEINLPTDCYKLLRVYLNGDEIKPTTIMDLNAERALYYDASWQAYVADTPQLPLSIANSQAVSAANGVEFKYYLREQEPKHLGFVPAVNTSVTLVIDYVQLPALPVTDQVALNYPHDMQQTIVKIALAELFKIMRRPEDATIAERDAMILLNRSAKAIKTAQAQYVDHIEPLPYMNHFSF